MTPGGTRGTLVVRGTALALRGRRLGRRGPALGEIRREVFTRLVGAFNVANTLTALGCGLGLGLDLERHAGRLWATSAGCRAAWRPVDAGQDFAVLVDYAHTPDSVRNVLRTAREFTRGRLIAVIGCGGDRDRTKRPLMGREAEELRRPRGGHLGQSAQRGPRGHHRRDPRGACAGPRAPTVQADRRLAICEAVAEARAGDVVMILGKGHESGQEFATETIPFDDRQVAREALLARGAKT